jgi:2-polyprenyl-3-methyl-5-hydroxy-6-metoxy-1,4-benzoquinol methylase
MASVYHRQYATHVGKETGYAGYRNRRRVRLFTELLRPRRGHGGRLLEIGCNTGALLTPLARQYREVHGIDQNTAAIARAKVALRRQRNVHLHIGSATKLPFPANFFDAVCAFEVIEHVRSPRHMLAEIARVLRPRGRAVLSFPLELIRGQAALLDAITIFKDPRYARKLHLHKLWPKRIARLLNETPLRITAARLRWIPFPSFVMELEKASRSKRV